MKREGLIDKVVGGCDLPENYTGPQNIWLP